MRVILFQHRFIEPLQVGTKRQTIRPPRKRSVVVGDDLSLRYWQDKPYRSQQVEILAARCTGVFDILVCFQGYQIGMGQMNLEQRPAKLDAFARGDGFSCWREFRDFLESRFDYGLPFAGKLIQFERRPGEPKV